MRPYVSAGLALALVASLGMAACNDADDSETAPPPPAQSEPATPPPAGGTGTTTQ
jgi:hypothetical protein